MRIADGTRILAVLNGRDGLLEGFWGMQRRAFFARLVLGGFSAVTGPTFSITSEERKPGSHNVCMLLRHHRVIEEIASTELAAIPNIYWRSTDDAGRWTEWLEANPNVRVVSRDFSRTKDKRAFGSEMAGLLAILNSVSRPFHVVLVGVGPRKARDAMVEVGATGHTCSVVTAYPVLVAIKQGREIVRRGKTGFEAVYSPERSRLDLAVRNIQTMEQYLCENAPPGATAGDLSSNWIDEPTRD
ncbi:MAG TPA: hypothetical protein VF092_18420 [Longimicrobium sp.]